MFLPQIARSNRSSRFLFLFRLAFLGACLLIISGVKMFQSYQLNRFDQYSLPQASYFPHCTGLFTLFIDNPTDTPGKEQMLAGTAQDRDFVMQLGHLVLDNVDSAAPLDKTTPLVDFRVYRGSNYIDILVCSQAKEFWITDNSANVPLISIEPGFTGRAVASGHLDRVAGQMSALINQVSPPAANDNPSDDSGPPD